MTRISFQRGSVQRRKRKSGYVWALRYRERDPDSKSGWKEKTQLVPECKSKKEALMALSERMEEINKRSENPKRFQTSRAVTLEGLVSGLWQSYVANKNYKPSTAYGYQSLLNAHIIPGLGKKVLTEIRPEDLSVFFDSVREREVSNKTLLNLYNLVDLLFDLAVQCDWIESSPVRPRLHRPDYRRVKKQALTPKQIAEVLEHVPREHFPLFATIALTGLRLGEALAPHWLDVDFSACTLSVTHSLWRGRLVPPKTDESEQTIHLAEELVRILLQHRERSTWTAPGDFVFSRADGSPWDPDHLRKMVLRPAMDAAGINRGVGTHGFHIFRHSAGSIVYDRTRDMRLAQELLRHTQIATTSDTYVHVDAAVAAEATETLAKAILPNYLISQTVAADLIVAAKTDVIQ